MRVHRWLPVLGLIAFQACDAGPAGEDPLEPAFAKGGNHPLNAVVEFGSLTVGTDFPPAEHDASFHAYDKVVRTRS